MWTFFRRIRCYNVAEWLACWTYAQKARVEIAAATLSGNSFRQTVHTHHASVHQAAKLIAALSRVAGVPSGLAENNGSLPPGLWFKSPAGLLPRTGISSGTLRSVTSMGYLFLFNVENVFRIENRRKKPSWNMYAKWSARLLLNMERPTVIRLTLRTCSLIHMLHAVHRTRPSSNIDKYTAAVIFMPRSSTTFVSIPCHGAVDYKR